VAKKKKIITNSLRAWSLRVSVTETPF